jgi:hypothetical protein
MGTLLEFERAIGHVHSPSSFSIMYLYRYFSRVILSADVWSE